MRISVGLLPFRPSGVQRRSNWCVGSLWCRRPFQMYLICIYLIYFRWGSLWGRTRLWSFTSASTDFTGTWSSFAFLSPIETTSTESRETSRPSFNSGQLGQTRACETMEQKYAKGIYVCRRCTRCLSGSTLHGCWLWWRHGRYNRSSGHGFGWPTPQRASSGYWWPLWIYR